VLEAPASSLAKLELRLRGSQVGAGDQGMFVGLRLSPDPTYADFAFFVFFLGLSASRSALIFANNASALLSPLMSSRFCARQSAVSSRERLWRGWLGQVIDPHLGIFDPLLYLVCVGEELFDAADDFGLFYHWR